MRSTPLSNVFSGFPPTLLSKGNVKILCSKNDVNFPTFVLRVRHPDEIQIVSQNCLHQHSEIHN